MQQAMDPPGQGPLKLREYQLLEKLGDGGMGGVYRALHLKLDRLFAVRMLSSACTQNREAIARFQREMKAAGILDHPGIIRATDAGEVDGNYFLVTELVDGVDLPKLIDKFGPLSVGAACETICQVADALQHLYEHGLVHRDIKPTNVMVDFAGQAKLLDLGLALLHPQQGLPGTTTESQVRHTDYTAPERLHDTLDDDIRSDIYSLGCTLYYLLTGRPPFDGDGGSTLAPQDQDDCQGVLCALNHGRSDVPRPVEEALQRMTARGPARRFRSPAEVVACLQGFADGGLGSLSSAAARQLSPAPDVGHQTFQLSTATGPAAEITLDGSEAGRAIQNSGPTGTVAEHSEIVVAPAQRAGRELSENREGQRAMPRSMRRLRAAASGVAVVLAIAGGFAMTIQLTRGGRPSAAPHGQSAGVGVEAATRNASVAVVQLTPREHRTALGSSTTIARPAIETETFSGHTRPALDIELSRDGRWLLAGGTDAVVRLWDVATGQQIHEMRGHTDYVAVVCFLADGQQALSGGKDQTIRRWDLATGEQLMTYERHASVVSALAASHNGERFLSGGFDALINLWNPDETSPEAIFGYRSTSDGWHGTDRSDLSSLRGHTSWVRSVAFAGDSTRFISAGNEALLAIWDVATGKIVHRLVGHTQPVTCAVFLPGDEQVISSSLDSTIRLWDAATGQLLQTFSLSAVPVVSVAVSPDGLRVAATGQDRSLTIVRLSDGQRLHGVDGAPAVGAVCWAPNGKSIFFAAADHSVRRWLIPPVAAE